MKRKTTRTAETLDSVLRRTLESAEAVGDHRTVLAVAKLIEERETLSMKTFLESDVWKGIVETMTEALTPYPDALKAVGLALQRLDEKAKSG